MIRPTIEVIFSNFNNLYTSQRDDITLAIENLREVSERNCLKVVVLEK